MQPGSQVQISTGPIQIAQPIGQQPANNNVLQQNVLLNKALGPVTATQAGQQVNTLLVAPTVQLQPSNQPQQANQIRAQQGGQQMILTPQMMNNQTQFQVIPSGQVVVSMHQNQPLQTGQVIGSMGGQTMTIDTVDGTVNQGNININRQFPEMINVRTQQHQQQQQQQQMPDQNQRFGQNQQMGQQMVTGQQVNIMSTGQMQVPNQPPGSRIMTLPLRQQLQQHLLQNSQQARMQQTSQPQVPLSTNPQLRHLLQQQQQQQQMQPGQQPIQVQVLSQPPAPIQGQMVMQQQQFQQQQQQNLQQRVNYNTDPSQF